jgi:uncharacterized protein (UPF0335 family)
MKPKNKFQQQVFELSKTLAPITITQKKWAFKNCIKHYGVRSAKGIITCLDCGHDWKGNSELGDILLGANCPQCSAKLTIETTRKRVFKQSAYFSLVTTKGNFQVLRYFLIKYDVKTGDKAHYFISEVVQRWIAPNGKYETIARMRPLSYYDDVWRFDTKLEIRPEKDHHFISPTCIYPQQKLIPELKRSGYNGDNIGLSHLTLFRTLLADSRAETLLKAGQIEVLQRFAGKNWQNIEGYWSAIKICLRNQYKINDATMWRDYIDLLRFFGKDLHNAKYVCPTDLTAEHDFYVKKKRAWQERINKEEKRKKALENEKKFHELKSRFFGIEFTDGIIQIRMLDSVEDVMKEGDILHHCVFTNSYHLRPDSLILSACIGEKRIETIEFSLSQMEVVQCRGLHNKNTEYHERIINLVKKNKRLIKKRMAA